MSLRIYSKDEFAAVLKGAAKAELGAIVAKDSMAGDIATEADRILQFCISDGSVDRDGDTISPTGWDLSEYQKAGVVLWAHDPSTPPIATPIATWLEGGKLKARAKFPGMDSANELGALVYDLYTSGALKATSVGFMPRKWQINEERPGGHFGPACDFLEQVLLEWSAVPIPANPNALHEASKALDLRSLATWAEKSLDTKPSEASVHFAGEVVKGMRGIVLPKSAALPDPRVTTPIADKGAISYRSTPKAPKDEAWDGPAETAAASVDDLKVICTWVEDGSEDKKSAYKLPHHKADGDHAVVWRGVTAAMGALLGARGGADIPERDRKAVYDHLAKHYRDFDEEPPEFKAISEPTDAEVEEAAISKILDDIKDLVKSGRVLSAANEQRLRQARDLIDAVVQQVELETDDGKSADDDALEIEGIEDTSQLAKFIGDAVNAVADQISKGNQP